MISAEEFIVLLEEKDLLEPELLADLRNRVAQSMAPVSASLIAKRLVDKGHLSRLSAQRLLLRAEEISQKRPLPRREDLSIPKATRMEDEELGLAPLKGEVADEEQGPVSQEAEADVELTEGGTWGAEVTGEEGPEPAAEPPASLFGEQPPEIVSQPAADKPVSAGQPGLQPTPGLGPMDNFLEETLRDSDLAEGTRLETVAPRKRGLLRIFPRWRKPGKKRGKENVWDSGLLLIGGGTLLGLFMIGGLLWWSLAGRSRHDILEQANNYYRDGSYTKAIDTYGEFLKRFPKHEGASMARVKRGLARMRQATDGTSDWPSALEAARRELKEIAGEEEFKTEARPELTAMLPDIAEGLADMAHAELDPKLVGLAEDALALVEKYVPTSARPVTRLNDVEARLASTRREIARGEKLQQAVADVKKAVDDGNTQQAYEIRRKLLKEYPTLANHKQLVEAILVVSRAELSAVELVQEQQPGDTTEPAALSLGTVALARRITTTDAPGTEGQVIFALAAGAAYGLDAASGKVLWRREVGFDVNGRTPSFPPTPIAEKGGSDPVLVGRQRNEVLRVEAATGRLRWRHPLKERFDAHPVVAEDRLLVATRSGRLVTINLESGDSPGYVQLPQELRVGPTVDVRRKSIFQVAEHSNLFVLSLEEGRAQEVVYLGHEPGTIIVPPVIISRFLIIAENDGVKDASLRVLSLDATNDGLVIKPLQRLRLKGRVNTPPLVSGARLVVVTDQGKIYVLEISATDVTKPLGTIAESQAAGDETLDEQQKLVRFPFMVGGQVWIADSQLTRYDVHASRGRLEPRWIANQGSAALQPLAAVGQTVFHTRATARMPGVVVSAVDMEKGQLVWETYLATGLATEPIVDAQANRVTAVTSRGAVFQLDAADINGHTVVDQPVAALRPAELRRPLTDVTVTEGGLLAMIAADGPVEIPVFDPQTSPARFRRVLLPDPLSCRPIAFAGGLLAPCDAGLVFLMDPRSGEKRTEPFQPRLESGVRVTWRQPALINENEIILTDGRSGLYRVGIRNEPKPHLAELASRQLTESIVSPIAVLGGKAYAVDATPSLVSFELSDLKLDPPRPLAARCVWGPRRVGDRVLLVTDDGLLYWIDADGKVRPDTLPYTPLAGAPLYVDGHYVMASAGGVIWRVDAATGKELASIETGLSLGTGPVPLGQQLLVGGHDGSLYKVKKP